MSIVADLELNEDRVHRGGGKLYLVEYASTKEPYCDHASLKANAAAEAVKLSTYGAVAAAGYVKQPFGASGTLDIDIFAQDAAAEQKAFSALSANDFTISALTTARTIGAVVKLNDADDYALTAWLCAGALAGTKFRDSAGVEYSFDEENIQRAIHLGNREIELQTTLMQVSKAEMDFILHEARDKYFAAKYVVPMGVLGKKIVVMRKVRIVPEVEIPFEGGADSVIPVRLGIITVGTYRPYEIYEG
ncbi:MAG: hypothetical protein PHI18_00155 [bacterium]|nr:hypothetical protein [bacterium]